MLNKLALYIGWTFIISTAWALAAFLSFWLLERALKTFKTWNLVIEAMHLVIKRKKRGGSHGE